MTDEISITLSDGGRLRDALAVDRPAAVLAQASDGGETMSAGGRMIRHPSGKLMQGDLLPCGLHVGDLVEMTPEAQFQFGPPYLADVVGGRKSGYVRVIRRGRQSIEEYAIAFWRVAGETAMNPAPTSTVERLAALLSEMHATVEPGAGARDSIRLQAAWLLPRLAQGTDA